MMCKLIRFLVVPTIFLFLVGCATGPETTAEEISTLTPFSIQTQITLPISINHSTTTSAFTETPERATGNKVHHCSMVVQLPTDSAEEQKIVDEFVANYIEQYPTEYMGIATLHCVDHMRVDPLGEWAVFQESFSR